MLTAVLGMQVSGAADLALTSPVAAVGAPLGAAVLASVVALLAARRAAAVEGIDSPPRLVVVLVAAAVGAALGLRLGALWVLPALSALAGSAAVLSVVDVRHKRLPDAVVGPTYLLVMPLLVFAAVAGNDAARLWRALIAAAVLGMLYLVLKIARPAGIGLGDVKLAPLLGAVVGWWGWNQVVLALFLAYLGAALLVVVGLVARRTTLRSEVPFGPFLLGGFLLATALPPL